MNTIGIVGGMGPYAGIDIIRKIFDQTRAKSDQDHLPVSMLSIPHRIKDRTEFLLGKTNENPALFISEVICSLHKGGASVIGMPCNTAHAEPIFKEIVKRIPKEVKLLNMINEVALYIKEFHPSFVNIGILSTNGTFKAGIYPHYLSKHGLNAIQVTEEIQVENIHPAIYSKEYGIKSNATFISTEAKKRIKLGIEYLVNRGAQAIILGCTEIPLAFKEEKINNIFLIDPAKILARSLILEFSPSHLLQTN